MEFLPYLEEQRNKLSSNEYCHLVWEILNDCQETQIPPSVKQQFKYHLPISSADFLKSCIQKLDEQLGKGNNLDDLTDQQRLYLLSLVHWFLFNDEEMQTSLLAAELYLQLIKIPNNLFFQDNLFLRVFARVSEYQIEINILPVLRRLRAFFKSNELETKHKDIVVDLLVDIIKSQASCIISVFCIDGILTECDHEALVCLKTLALKDESTTGLFMISKALLTGVTSFSNNTLTPQRRAIIQRNLRNLIKDLHDKILYDSYSALKNALIHTWTCSDFQDYEACVAIMNDMNLESYQFLTEKMNRIMVSKDDVCKKNMNRLAHAILLCPPEKYPKDKLKVMNQIMIRNLIMNTGSNSLDVYGSAIEVIAALCDGNGPSPTVTNSLKVVLDSPTDTINKDTFLKRLITLVDLKWKCKLRNRNICTIFCFLLESFSNLNKYNCSELLKSLSAECSPFDMKSCLSNLNGLYVHLNNKGDDILGQLVFHVLYKMAMHPQATSSEFVKLICYGMITPMKVDGVAFKPDIYVNPLINSNVDYKAFFKKCQSLSLLRPTDVKKIILDLSLGKETNTKLLCAILDILPYNDYNQLTDYVLHNFETLVNNEDTKYVFYALNCIISKAQNSHRIVRLETEIAEALKEQRFPSKVIANTINLLKRLNSVTRNNSFRGIEEIYETKLLEALDNLSDINNLICLSYAAELTLLTQYIPGVQARNKLVQILVRSSTDSLNIERQGKYDVWIFCIILYAAIALKDKNSVSPCLNFLRRGLKSCNTAVKLTSIRLYYDLSDLVLRNYEGITTVLFAELIGESAVVKDMCIRYLEKLVRDEYLKLSGSQFLKFICLLREQNNGVGDFVTNLLADYFVMTHQSTIARNFVSLIVHFSQYKKHPIVKTDESVLQFVEKTSGTLQDKGEIYGFLFKPLAKKLQFNVIKEISTHIIENVINEKIRFDNGFWDMISDSILIIKIISTGHHKVSEDSRFLKKMVTMVEKNIVEKNDSFAEKPKYMEFQSEINRVTTSLLKLLFFNDSNYFPRHIKFSLFVAIMHWTNYIFPDVVHLANEENCKALKMVYAKLPQFYKKEIHVIRVRASEEVD